jgi:hypothetical protein
MALISVTSRTFIRQPGRDGDGRQRNRAAIGRLRRRRQLRPVRRITDGEGAQRQRRDAGKLPDAPGSWTVAVTNRGDKKAGDATVKLYAVCIKK